MSIFNLKVVEFAAQQGISVKHIKLISLCIGLLLIKFVYMPLIEWQMEMIDDTAFYRLQYRDENSIKQALSQAEDFKQQVEIELANIEKLYAKGASTKNQVRINDLIDKKIDELGLKLASKNSAEINEKNGIAIVEYYVRARGMAEPLQEFVYWLDTVEPKLLILNTRFTSSNGSAVAEVNVRFQQLILTGAEIE